MTEKNKQIKLEVPTDLEPIFANGIATNFKDDEFVFSFLHTAPNLPSMVKAVISMTPRQVKRFQNALDRTIKMYEDKFEKIKLPEKPEEPEKHNRGIEVA